MDGVLKSRDTKARGWRIAAVLVPVLAGIAAGQPPLNPPAQHPALVAVPGSTDPTSVLHDPAPVAPNPPAALPGLPSGVGMGGMPGPPLPLREVNSFSELNNLVRDNLTVRLRGAGILRPYGIFRGDFDFATNKFSDIQNPFFVLPGDPAFLNGPGRVPSKTPDPNYSLYPRLTRFGFEYYGNKVALLCDAIPSGRLEFDFLTPNPNSPGFNTESRQFLRLRLAYVQLTHGEFTLVVGQDWDIIAPLIPTIDDNTLLWNVGNMGDRRPQVKFLWDHDFGGFRVQLQNGIAVGDAIDNLDLDQNGFRDQEDSGLPAYQARLGFVVPTRWGDNQPIMAGVWGVLSQDSTNRPVGTLNRTRFLCRGIGADLRVPITGKVAFQGEAFYGRNLDDWRAGIGQGINAATGETIETRGGWGEIVYRPVSWYQVSVGASVDDPANSDIPTGGRTLNYVWYVGNRFPVGNGLLFGLDYENWTTRYSGFRQGKASRIKLFASLAF
jgi:hypothetical protein